MILNKKKYFNIIELIIIFVVLGVMATLTVPKLQGIIKNSNIAAMYKDIDSLDKAIKLYQIYNEDYPILLKEPLLNNKSLINNIIKYKDNRDNMKIIDLSKLEPYITTTKYGKEFDINENAYLINTKSEKIYYNKGLMDSTNTNIHTLKENKSINNMIEIPQKENQYLTILLNFIDNNMIYENGIIQRYKLNSTSKIYSKSQATMLLFSVYKEDRERFDKFFNIINKRKTSEGLIVRETNFNGEIIDGNFDNDVISELITIKALLLGYEKWGDIIYKDNAFKIANSLKKYCVDENYNLLGFYQSWMGNKGLNKNIFISDLDLESMELLAKYDSDWNKIYNNSKNIIRSAYVSNKIPLYKNEYNYDTGISSQIKIDTEKAFITLLNLSSVGEDISYSMEWIKNIVSSGNTLTSYYYEDGTPEGPSSPILYSLLIEICQQQGEYELMEMLVEKVVSSQANDYGWNISNKDDIRYGSFVDIANDSDTWDMQNIYPLFAYLYFY